MITLQASRYLVHCVRINLALNCNLLSRILSYFYLCEGITLQFRHHCVEIVKFRRWSSVAMGISSRSRIWMCWWCGICGEVAGGRSGVGACRGESLSCRSFIIVSPVGLQTPSSAYWVQWMVSLGNEVFLQYLSLESVEFVLQWMEKRMRRWDHRERENWWNV